MNKHLNSNKWLLVATLVIMLLVVELCLRLFVNQPGQINNFGGFTKVDTLIQYQNFCTDEVGIYKFSPWVTDSLLVYFDCQKRKITNTRIKDAIFDGDKVFYVYQNYCKQKNEVAFSWRWWVNELHNGEENKSNCLTEIYEQLQKNVLPYDSGWQAAFLAYYNKPFNKDGFRGVPLANYKTKQLKVLVIGDSFVYGMDAHPQQNSFVDLLLTKGYLVYACGIPGTDPAQYAAIAEKYIPIVEPDVVVSCFYTGNDYMKYYREPNQLEPHEYITNAGFYSSNPLGKHLSAEKAYSFYLNLSTFPDSSNRLFDKICSYTSLGTLLWNALYQNGYLKHVCRDYFALEYGVPKDTIYARTKVYTDRLSHTCKKYKVPQLITVIPDLDVPHFDTLGLQTLFGKNYLMPNNLDLEKDYHKKGFHFNNKGSKKYADFLDSILRPLATNKSLINNAKAYH